MGNRAKSFDKNVNLRAMALGASVLMPPTILDALVASAAISTYTPGTALTLVAGGTSQYQPWAWALVITKTAVAGLSAVKFKIKGLNQFDEDVTETVDFAAGATETKQTVNAYRYIEAIIPLTTTSGDDTVTIGWDSDVGGSKSQRIGTPWRMAKSTEIHGMCHARGAGVAAATQTPSLAAADFSASAQTMQLTGHVLTITNSIFEIFCFPNKTDRQTLV